MELPEKIRRKSSEIEEQERVHQFWVDVFAGVPRPGDEEVVAMAWRLTRRLAQMKGILNYGQFLRDATALSPSPWERPVKRFKDAIPSREFAIRAIQEAPLPLSPPSDRRELQRWARAMRLIGYGLDALEGVRERQVLQALVRVPEEYWPAKTTIMRWEEEILQEALDLLIDDGFKAVSRRLQERYHLTMSEAFEVVNMAQALALPSTVAPTEALRALAVMRLESLIKRCRREGDARAELMAHKALIKLLGLNRPVAKALEDDDFVQEMERVIETKAIEDSDDEDE